MASKVHTFGRSPPPCRGTMGKRSFIVKSQDFVCVHAGSLGINAAANRCFSRAARRCGLVWTVWIGSVPCLIRPPLSTAVSTECEGLSTTHHNLSEQSCASGLCLAQHDA
eukprot:66262-Chlamydomonas_euryale.AAC.5